MTKFIFDLDGTVTKEETLPLIAEHFSVEEEIMELTRNTVDGRIPFIESFIRRVYVLGKLPVDEIAALLGNVKLYDSLCSFINEHRENCCVATGNLADWVCQLNDVVRCDFFCSEANIENNSVKKLTSILRKENVVNRYKSEGHKVVFIGDGNNDVEAMRCADIAIASGLTHEPAMSVLSVADYLIYDEETLCRQLNRLL